MKPKGKPHPELYEVRKEALGLIETLDAFSLSINEPTVAVLDNARVLT